MPRRIRRAAGAASNTAPGLTTTLIVVLVIAALTFLVYEAKVNGDAAIALFSAIIGGIISRAGAASGAQNVVDPPSDA